MAQMMKDHHGDRWTAEDKVVDGDDGNDGDDWGYHLKHLSQLQTLEKVPSMGHSRPVLSP